MYNSKNDGESIYPSVTVVIPAYNAAAFIERTIRSAALQTYPRLSILVVNDGSTDRTQAILERLSKEFPALAYVQVSNGGVARARNIGTEMAETDYVAYLDADDLWHPTKIEKQVAALLQHGNDPSWVACYALSRIIDRDDNHISSGRADGPQGDFFAEHLVDNHVGNGSSLLVSRAAALAVGGFNPSYADMGIGGCEDRDFQLRLLRNYKMELVREFLIGYRAHPTNMSSNHLAMGRGNNAVITGFLDDPRATPKVRARALASSNCYAWTKFARGGHAKDAAVALSVALRHEPIATSRYLWTYFTKRARRLARKLVEKVGYQFKSTARRKFDDFDPLEGIASKRG